jgi:hypothetical protein
MTKPEIIEQICTIRIFLCGPYAPGIRENFERKGMTLEKPLLETLLAEMKTKQHPQTGETYDQREARILKAMIRVGL